MQEGKYLHRKRHKTRTPGVMYRLDANGKRRYVIGYRDSSRKQVWRSELGWTLADAEEALAKMRADSAPVPTSVARRVRFGDLAEAWLAEQTHLRQRTRENYRWALDQHLHHFDDRRVATLTEQDITHMLGDLRAKGYAGSTQQGVLLPLRQILDHAVRHGIIATNPLDRLARKDKPQKARSEKRCLSADEIAKLLDAATDEAMRTLLALSVSTGIRQGEALGLRWADVDLSTGTLRVRFGLGRDRKLSEPKTPQAKRDVDLAPSLVAMLRSHKLASLRSQPGNFVFSQPDGSPLHYQAANRALHAATKRANLNTDGLPKLRWHDLRHTAASLLISEGLNIVYVSRVLGHANPSITLNVYGHLFARAEHAERARAAMDTALGAGSERVAGQRELDGNSTAG